MKLQIFSDFFASQEQKGWNPKYFLKRESPSLPLQEQIPKKLKYILVQ